jgi:hypothetical protein
MVAVQQPARAEKTGEIGQSIITNAEILAKADKKRA